MKKSFFLHPKVTEDFGKNPHLHPDPLQGSVSQRYGSEDPDPYQNVTDPEHCN
jgi:hypothetical protein